MEILQGNNDNEILEMMYDTELCVISILSSIIILLMLILQNIWAVLEN